MSQLKIEEERQSHDFEIVLLDKDYDPVQNCLVPNGKKVSYCSDEGSKIWDFWQKHEDMMKAKMGKRGRKKNRKRQKKNKED